MAVAECYSGNTNVRLGVVIYDLHAVPWLVEGKGRRKASLCTDPVCNLCAKEEA